MKIATLGPDGTYSAQAASNYNPAAELLFCGTIREVLKKVENSEAEAGIVPLENSIEGIVAESLDGIAAGDLLITDELVVDIHHSVCGITADIKPAEVQTIYSHPQALAQCAEYLSKNYPKADRAMIGSTAAAMEAVAWSKERSRLAIGSEFAAKKYGLQILDGNIEDENGNQTRFVVVSKNSTGQKLPFTLVAIKSEADRPGLLHDILGIIKDQAVNMLQIDSRPDRSKLGSYVFYVRLGIESGDPKYDKIAELIQEMDVNIRRLSA
jgi:prephenate dehydratase